MGAWSMIDWNCASFARNAASASSRLLDRGGELLRPARRLRRSASLRARISRANMRQAKSSRTPNAATMPAEMTALVHQAARISFFSSDTAISIGGAWIAPVGAEVLRPARLERCAHEAGRRSVLQARDERIVRASRPRSRSTGDGSRNSTAPDRVHHPDVAFLADVDRAVEAAQPFGFERRHQCAGEVAVRDLAACGRTGMANWPLACPRTGGSAARPGSASVERRRKMFVSARDCPISAGTVE